MVKIININASYNNQNHIFECEQQEFLEKAAEYFNINIRDVELYSVNKGQRRKITPLHITDLMKIEIVRKGAVVSMGRQRSVHEYFGNDSLKADSVDHIITKLTQNTSLTGQERKSLVEWLRNYSAIISNKRKFSAIASTNGVATANKKVQVDASKMLKTSFTQTDLIPTTILDEEHNRGEQISNKIKRLAMHSDTSSSEEVALLMRESFDDRRNFIFIKVPPVCAVKDKYPSLFCLEEVKNELGRIFYAEKCNEFIDNMHKYARFIIEKCTDEDLHQRTKNAIDHARTEVQKQYARVVGSVFILATLMEEDFRFMHLEDYPHGSQDVYPHIDASLYSLKKVFRDECLFKIVVEGQHLCEASNLLEAVLCLLGSFFIFNIDYPESCRRTMIMFEKLYLDANDTLDLDDHTIQMIKLLKLEANSEP